MGRGGPRGGGRGGGRRGGGRGGNRGGKAKEFINRREAFHLQQFGENHPSKELQDFGAPSAKKQKFNGRGNFGSRGRGFGRGYNNNNNNDKRQNAESSSEESEEEEEITPYNELLSIFSKSKSKNQVQIVSDEEEEDDEEVQDSKVDDTDDSENSLDDEEESGGEDSGGSSSGDGDSDSNSDDDSQKNISSKKHSSNLKTKTKSENIKDVQNEEEDIDAAVGGDADEAVIEETEIDPEMEAILLDKSESADPFLLHLEREMPELLQTHLKGEKPEKVQIPCAWPVLDKFNYIGLNSNINKELENEKSVHSVDINLSSIGKAKQIVLPGAPINPPKNSSSLEALHIKQQIRTTFPIVNQAVIDKELCSGPLTPLQNEILSIAGNYYDVYFPVRTLENSDSIRNAYCLHAANHVLKTRTRILHHNAKMVNKVDVPDAYRDQGFVRPKVLILVPFKDSAFKIIQTLLSLFLTEEKGHVENKKRFVEEYGSSTLFLPKTNPKPDDYNAIFGGNVEDNFKIGLSLTKKTVKLYTGFYAADIIVASPLGLRLIVGAEGEKDRDYDFLSSIELLIMDQADIFLMQNWDHLLHLLKHVNLQPVTTHGTDFARIRPWALDGLTKYFRQTLVFSSIFCPEQSALMSRYCQNYAGQIRGVNNFSRGTIIQITAQLPQVFQFFDCPSLAEADDARFDYFVKKVLPSFSEKLMSHTLIFISSYFDFVRLRNHFKREEKSFVQICEYTKEKKIARARDYFFHGQGHFLLYTERVHFFRRFRLKGIGHILFYQLPQYPHFYSELCDSIREDCQNRRVRQRKNNSVNVLYCKYDAPRLAAIVGSERASHMLSSDKKVHAFVSGEL